MPRISSLDPLKLTRRAFLRLGLAGLAAGVATVAPGPLVNALDRVLRWSDPSTWGGKVPGPGDVAFIRRPILLDVDARVAGVVIGRSGDLIFDPQRRVRLESTGNVVVQGRLTMKPDKPRAVHRLIFPAVDESRFVGGGMDVVASDVGLWVMDKGVLDFAGSKKLAWIRTAGAVAAGATTIELRDDPVGWRVGDELAITPTISPAVADPHLAYDYATVARINGRTVMLKSPTVFEHPAVNVGRGQTFTPEVLNLTRNVRIEGTPAGRAHIFIHSSRRQAIRRAAIRHMGPRQPDGDYTKGVLGRYGLHFHHSQNGSRGSLVAGVVVRDCGNHAFVAHESHGVTFRQCISHDTFDDPYWWDQRPPDEPEAPAPPTDDVLYDRCVASLVQTDPPFRGFRMGGFVLGARNGNKALGCVAVGVQGGADSDSCGFAWDAGSVGVWTFEDCVAHNNRQHGIMVWQNSKFVHVVTRFIGYHNGGAGISHGAYRNRYRYKDGMLYGNKRAGVLIHAVGDSEGIRFEGELIDAAGFSDYAFNSQNHTLEPVRPVLLSSCTFRGYTKAALGCAELNNQNADWYELDNCVFEGNELWLEATIHPSSQVTFSPPQDGWTQARRYDEAGTFNADWNASVS